MSIQNHARMQSRLHNKMANSAPLRETLVQRIIADALGNINARQQGIRAIAFIQKGVQLDS